MSDTFLRRAKILIELERQEIECPHEINYVRLWQHRILFDFRAILLGLYESPMLRFMAMVKRPKAPNYDIPIFISTLDGIELYNVDRIRAIMIWGNVKFIHYIPNKYNELIINNMSANDFEDPLVWNSFLSSRIDSLDFATLAACEQNGISIDRISNSPLSRRQLSTHELFKIILFLRLNGYDYFSENGFNVELYKQVDFIKKIIDPHIEYMIIELSNDQLRLIDSFAYDKVKLFETNANRFFRIMYELSNYWPVQKHIINIYKRLYGDLVPIHIIKKAIKTSTSGKTIFELHEDKYKAFSQIMSEMLYPKMSR